MSYTIDIHRRIYDDKEGVCIEVRPCPENPSDYLEIRTPDDKSKEYYGAISISFPKGMARLLGQALIDGSTD